MYIEIMALEDINKIMSSLYISGEEKDISNRRKK